MRETSIYHRTVTRDRSLSFFLQFLGVLMSVLVAEISPPAVIATWARVGADLWVASDPDGFVGTVERLGERFVACDRFAVEIGSSTDLDAAKASVLERPLERPAPRGERTRLAWVSVAAGVAVVGLVSWMASGWWAS
jgi:hypothetical protein